MLKDWDVVIFVELTMCLYYVWDLCLDMFKGVILAHADTRGGGVHKI